MSLGWSLVVWVFGEAFGGLLSGGQTWLTGAPGAALFYCAASVLLVAPAKSWRDVRLGRGVLQAMGLLLLGCAVLQAWPGRGFWQGMLHGRPGSLAAAVGGMAAMRQPTVFHEFVGSFGSLVARHGFAVNLCAIVAMAAVGGCLLAGRAAIAAPAAGIAVVLCLADWVFVQDLGFLGGLGTDPNSMVPQALILTGGLVAMIAAPAAVSPPAYLTSHRTAGPPVVSPVLARPVSAGPVPASPVPASPVPADRGRWPGARSRSRIPRAWPSLAKGRTRLRHCQHQHGADAVGRGDGTAWCRAGRAGDAAAIGVKLRSPVASGQSRSRSRDAAADGRAERCLPVSP